jgi:hypothetical protein
MEDLDYSSPNILFLQGCFLKDCRSIEDIFDDRLISQLDTTAITELKHSPLSSIFTSKEEWPTSTTLKCWSCSCNFTSSPIFIPSVLYPSSDSTKTYPDMKVYGNFCTWQCAALYINTYFLENDRWERYNMLKVLYKIMTGLTACNIPQAPHKTIMIQYGGVYTVEQFRSMFTNISHTTT